MARFQFTHPGRGATSDHFSLPARVAVSIHAPREGCDHNCQPTDTASIVSIHAPREGCDLRDWGTINLEAQFQFTHPGRGATPSKEILEQNYQFQFTHPGRGATSGKSLVIADIVFQFTHPGRGATILLDLLGQLWTVSIHAPREGCDTIAIDRFRDWSVFQFTHPGRGATHLRPNPPQ